ncbi:MAG: hypothetical protein Alis3KO_12760 [Aliiglaciecola sp.]
MCFKSNASQESLFKFYANESPDWSQPTIQSDSWSDFDQQVRNFPQKGMFWIVVPIEISPLEPPQLDWELNVHMLASYQVFFDDLLIGDNGVPSQAIENEVPGLVWMSYLVPNQKITAGKHQLRFKASSHHREQGMKLLREVWLEPYDPAAKYISFWSLIPTLLVSIASVVGLYFLFLFFSDGRQYEHLIFFILLQAMMVYGYTIQWDHLVGYTYDSEAANLLIEKISSLTVLLSLPLYFLLKHTVKRAWLWMLGMILLTAIALSVIPVSGATVLWSASFLTSLLISVWFGAKRHPRFWWESAGIAICLIAIFWQSLEDLFIYFPILFSFILLTQAIKIRERRIALQEAEYIQARLNAELLKKHIQPHFLLNTLTSLMEWVETDVEKGIDFIALLGDEFRMMAKVSNQRLVPLATEIELCEKHLALMSMRLDCECELNKILCDDQKPFPPAVLHTLIENAFSNNVFYEEKLSFKIEQTELADNKYLLRLITPRSDAKSSAFGKIGTGTGTKYIKSRLSQCFGKNWQYNVVETQCTYTTEICLNYRGIEKQDITI